MTQVEELAAYLDRVYEEFGEIWAVYDYKQWHLDVDDERAFAEMLRDFVGDLQILTDRVARVAAYAARLQNDATKRD